MTGDDRFVADEKLSALFHDAAADAPPPGFDARDVTAASRRITARRRSVLIGGAVVAVVAAVGIGTVVSVPRDQDTVSSAAAPEAASPLMAGQGARAAAPLGPATAECVDKHDPALRALVEQVLPEAAGATDAVVTLECTAGGGRGMNVEVTDGGVTGLLNVTYDAPGTTPRVVAGAISAPTASGGTVVVSSEAVGPGGGPAPFAARLPSVLEYLAPRL